MGSTKRIELGQKMVELWTSKSCGSDRAVTFVKDMMGRLSAGRVMSPKQRDWFDSAVLTEPPLPQNEELVNRLRADAALSGMEDVKEPLTDFAYKLSKGWNLSEKQTAFMQKMMGKADDIREHGPWQPTSEERAAMDLGMAFTRRYSVYYLNGQPGLSKSMDRYNAWVAGLTSAMDEWSAKLLMNLCKGEREQMVDTATRWPIGSLAETRPWSGYESQVGLVLDAPHVNEKGMVALMILLEGEPRSLVVEQLKKPRKTRQKKLKVD